MEMLTYRIQACFLTSILCAAQVPLAQRLDERIPAALKSSGAPSVSVAVVENGKLAYAKAFGKADIEKNRDADPDTRYAIGSVSKQFTAVALLMLQEQGKLSLDDKVGKYFPEMSRANETTVRQLLSHTAGYEDFAPQDYIIPDWQKPTTTRATLEKWATKPLNFDPGTRWQYSNTGYVLAGAIFEKASGQGLVAFLTDKIFRPLGMTSAADCDVRNPADATAYTRFALGPSRPVAREAEGWYFAAGELCMTASDLAKWNVAFLEKRFLSAKSYEEFMREVKLNDGKPTRYALGLTVGEMAGAPMVSHGGEVSGFLTANNVFPTKGAAVTVLSNSDGLGLTGQLAAQISAMLVGPPQAAASPAEIKEVETILKGLQQGEVDRAQFTANANSYFTALALGDFRSSLSPLGPLKAVTKGGEQLRGGMIHRNYRAQFEKGSLSLNIYVYRWQVRAVYGDGSRGSRQLTAARDDARPGLYSLAGLHCHAVRSEPRKMSTRDPNLISPMRSPVATRSPGFL